MGPEFALGGNWRLATGDLRLVTGGGDLPGSSSRGNQGV